MREILKKIFKKMPLILQVVMRNIRSKFVDIYAIKSYSQEGEDIILRRVFSDQTSGYYIDVGAHHPRRLSNTCYFYKLGWTGINIEPNPNAFLTFQKERPRDLNLQLGVAAKPSMLKYYHFNDPALNTFDSKLSKKRLKRSPFIITKTEEINVETLEKILDKYLPLNKKIDFITIDAEGFDMQVLQSNNWQKYRPKYLLVEDLNFRLYEMNKSQINIFMKSKNYELFAKTYNTLFFIDCNL
jgi:FkbM family methyltransferase